jgi:spore maturation protein CgeB
MKILFSGYHNPHFMTITEYMERAAEKSGHSLLSFDDRSFIIPNRIRKKLKFLQNWDLARLNNKFVSLSDLFRPDLCLIMGGHRILPETIEKIKRRGIKTVLWTIDVPSDFQPIIEAAPHYDFVFCGGTEAQELLDKISIKKTYWLPFACDPEVHRFQETTPEERKFWGSDVTFIGSFYPNRAQLLEKLVDFDFKVWGPGWNKLPSASRLRKKVRDLQLKPEEWTKILSSCKITLVIHYQDGTTPCYQASPKVYETLACKSFLLVDNQRDVKLLFEDGKHLAIFKDVEDLKEKIIYYLNHQGDRERIINQGCEEAVQRHAYIHRLKQMLDIIEAER